MRKQVTRTLVFPELFGPSSRHVFPSPRVTVPSKRSWRLWNASFSSDAVAGGRRRARRIAVFCLSSSPLAVSGRGRVGERDAMAGRRKVARRGDGWDRAPFSPFPMPSRQAYAPLSQQDDNELEAAFQSDDDDAAPDTRALISTHPQPPELHDGAYDFEPRFEDYASRIPDGSPPPMPPAAGNSNGLLPGPPAVPKRPNWLTRTLSSFRRSQDQHARFVGRGTDGVFGNVVAKPTVPGAAPVDDDVRVLPEETRSDAPPVRSASQALSVECV